MRPIDIAPIPKNNDGSDKTVINYQDWRQDLINEYGPHCAYCNCKIPNSSEVEHEVAKSLAIVAPTEWSNLVIACKPCNTAKTNHHFTVATHFVPTCHNTHMAFDYKIVAHPKLINHIAYIPIPKLTFPATSVAFAKAQRTIRHLRLDRVEQDKQRTKRATDIRWKNRYEAYLETQSARKLWNDLNTPQQEIYFIEDMTIRAFNTGFFSLWYNAFHDQPKVLLAIINAFKRTSIDSFLPASYQPKIRIAGDL